MTTPTSTERERLYKAPRKAPEFVRVPEIAYIMIDGHGDPNTSSEYRDAIQALYALSYGLKFALKKEEGTEYRVGPLESLWWSDDPAAFSAGRKGEWQWTAMIAQPDAVEPDLFARIRDQVARKKDLPGLAKARLERFEEGLCAQILHVGPFTAEGPTIATLHAFIRDHGHSFDGTAHKHHEIYLSDVRRAAPERWKTVIRQPVAGGL
jgi:hypothetical protein